MQANNTALNSWKLEENYEDSFVNPAKAVAEYGDKGQIIAFLADKVVFGNEHIFNDRKERFVAAIELFLEIYDLYKKGAEVEEWKKVVYEHQKGLIDLVAMDAVHRQYDPDNQKVAGILERVKPGDYRFLYLYGLPVSDNEIRTAKFIDSLSDEELTAMMIAPEGQQLIDLPREIEVFGVNEWGEEETGSRWEYFKKLGNRICGTGDDAEYSEWWWMNTPRRASAAYFCRCDSFGGANSGSASGAIAYVRPRFILAVAES